MCPATMHPRHNCPIATMVVVVGVCMLLSFAKLSDAQSTAAATTTTTDVLYDLSIYGVDIAERSVLVRDVASIDIQVCLANLLSDDRVGFETQLRQTLKSTLGSSAIYLISLFSSEKGDFCFMYIYQAADTSAAQQAFSRLSPKGDGEGNTFTLTVMFQGRDYATSTTASPWQKHKTPFNLQLPDAWTMQDLILWGSCLAGFFALSTCCLCAVILRRTFMQDTENMLNILQDDTSLVSSVQKLAAELKKKQQMQMQKKKDGKEKKNSED